MSIKKFENIYIQLQCKKMQKNFPAKFIVKNFENPMKSYEKTEKTRKFHEKSGKTGKTIENLKKRGRT